MGNLKTVNQLNNDSGEKLKIIQDALAELKSSYQSDYDIVQRFLFMVELMRGEKLAQVFCDYPEFKNVELENIPIEDIADSAIETFNKVIPMDEFLAYRKLLQSPVIKKMMSYYPDLVKEFDNNLKQKYV